MPQWVGPPPLSYLLGNPHPATNLETVKPPPINAIYEHAGARALYPDPQTPSLGEKMTRAGNPVDTMWKNKTGMSNHLVEMPSPDALPMPQKSTASSTTKSAIVNMEYVTSRESRFPHVVESAKLGRR